MTSIRAILPALVGALLASSVAAQDTPAPDEASDLANESGEALRQERQERIAEDEIVVTGRAQEASRAEIHRQARDVTPPGDIRETPLARYETPLCPGIIGLTVQAAVPMIDRIRTNAEVLGVRLAPDECNPNMVLVFADDGQALLSGMMEENPARFQYLTPVARQELRAPGPVRVWTDVQQATRDGMRVPRSRNLVNPPQVRMDMAHSHIYTTVRNEIDMVWVIIDREAARGLSLMQLADYATMRGLVQTEPQEDLAISSILGLFNEDGPWPDELTDFDRAYLTAVYDYIPNLPAFRKLGRVAEEVRRIEAAQLVMDGDEEAPRDQ
ncbi:DUF3987 domain-containing protein [Alteraurantiacibacter aquimixticola]|uniref:DUF2927 domain-containing protein n=1 Tax=Alteraurantiacibacter aquimixticola TaxID=2489173 RepID=A0A4V4U872_9SPHN|nr:DUF3987 domain-containing protein [Alteraurantiacibacter aquimixticola]TIX48787.1 hypothetical protein E5222_13640 [Alteraurantiacibacter aquimixticola]